MLASARENDKGVVDPFERNRETIENKKKKKTQNIDLLKHRYTSRRGSYKKNTVKTRCREFAQAFEALGFPIGIKINERILRYRMLTLDLCHDRVTVNQYIERLCLYGFFKILPNGVFEFRSTLPLGQQALQKTSDPETTMYRLKAVLKPLPPPKGNY